MLAPALWPAQFAQLAATAHQEPVFHRNAVLDNHVLKEPVIQKLAQVVFSQEPETLHVQTVQQGKNAPKELENQLIAKPVKHALQEPMNLNNVQQVHMLELVTQVATFALPERNAPTQEQENQ